MKTEIACNNYFDAQLPKYTPTYIHIYTTILNKSTANSK